jgi:hypothetical protein
LVGVFLFGSFVSVLCRPFLFRIIRFYFIVGDVPFMSPVSVSLLLVPFPIVAVVTVLVVFMGSLLWVFVFVSLPVSLDIAVGDGGVVVSRRRWLDLYGGRICVLWCSVVFWWCCCAVLVLLLF